MASNLENKDYRDQAWEIDNPEFQDIFKNNVQDHGTWNDKEPRNIGPAKKKGTWPPDRNMYLTVTTKTEPRPNTREVYDSMRDFGLIVRFIADEKIKFENGITSYGYWCCFRNKGSADELVKQLQSESILRGLLGFRARVYYVKTKSTVCP